MVAGTSHVARLREHFAGVLCVPLLLEPVGCWLPELLVFLKLGLSCCNQCVAVLLELGWCMELVQPMVGAS